MRFLDRHRWHESHHRIHQHGCCTFEVAKVAIFLRSTPRSVKSRAILQCANIMKGLIHTYRSPSHWNMLRGITLTWILQDWSDHQHFGALDPQIPSGTQIGLITKVFNIYKSFWKSINSVLWYWTSSIKDLFEASSTCRSSTLPAPPLWSESTWSYKPCEIKSALCLLWLRLRICVPSCDNCYVASSRAHGASGIVEHSNVCAQIMMCINMCRRWSLSA